MRTCFKAQGINMLDHGNMVHAAYKELIADLEIGKYDNDEFKVLHELYLKYKDNLPPADVLENYHVLHDCGKHLCLTIDENGKRSYPNHAAVSAQQFSILFPDDGFTKQLIAMDMDFHTKRGDELLELCRSVFAPILYFTAWAEINANAEMFGGRSSESYKIKRSRLLQAGKKLLKI